MGDSGSVCVCVCDECWRRVRLCVHVKEYSNFLPVPPCV